LIYRLVDDGARPAGPRPKALLPTDPRLALRQYLWAAIVVVVALAIYLPGLGNELVYDDGYLTDGDLFAVYRSLGLRTRMLSYGSFVWIQSLLGEGWWKQRLVNLAIHLAVVAALWAFYREILRKLVPSEPDPGMPAQPLHLSPALGVSVGFFALNPVAVYAVAYLIQRSILLATLFTVVALWLFARGLRTGKWWLHLLAAISYALAVMSKEHAVLAPLAAVPVYIVVARPSAKRLAILGTASAALIAAAGAALWARFGYILGTPFDEYSRAYLAQLAALNPDAPRLAWPLSIVNQCWLFFEYGVRWFFPVADWMSISIRPPFPVTWLSFPQILGVPLYVAVIAMGLRLVVRHHDWRALVGLSLLLPAILFGTEFVTVWVQDPFVLYRSYLWAIGVPGLVFVFLNGTSTRALAVVAAIVGLLLGWQAIERVMSLSTAQTAWTDAIAKLPKDPRAVGRWFPYLNRGSYYAEHDRFELAIRDFESSAALGDLGMGAFNAGSMLNATGKPQQALQMFAAAEKQGYDLYSLPFQRGLAYAALGKPDEAQRQFAAAMAMNPPSPTREILMLQLGRSALQTGQADAAISHLEAFLKKEPRHGEARYLLAMAYIAKREPARALEVIDAAGRASGGPAHYARAVASYGLGRKADALREIDAAIRMDPRAALLRELRAKIAAMP
jgi:protein O-mannosyl-transferase